MSKITSWMYATPEETWERLWTLEGELSLAAALLESREHIAEIRGEARSELVTDLQVKWRALIDKEPTTQMEEMA